MAAVSKPLLLLFSVLISTALISRTWATGPDEDAAALAKDDQCDAGDDQCALSALQRRGQRVTVELASDQEGSEDRPHRSSARATATDLTATEEATLTGEIQNISDDCTLLELKLSYLGMDVDSTNNTIFGIKDKPIGVNGTVVKWTDHDVKWIPTLTMLTDAEGFALEGNTLVHAEAPSVLEEDVERSGKPHPEASQMPPREKRVQQFMTDTQKRLDKIWKGMTVVERRAIWQENYMGAHRRMLNGRPVLLQEEPDDEAQDKAERLPTAPPPGGEDAADPLAPAPAPGGAAPPSPAAAKAHKKTVHHKPAASSDEDEPAAPVDNGAGPADTIMDQIASARNQTGEIWSTLGSLGTKVEALKKRVAKYTQGKPIKKLLLEESESVNPEPHVPAANGEVNHTAVRLKGFRRTPPEDADLRTDAEAQARPIYDNDQ